MGVAFFDFFYFVRPLLQQLLPFGSTSPDFFSWRQARIRETATPAQLRLGVAGLPDCYRCFRLQLLLLLLLLLLRRSAFSQRKKNTFD